MGVPLRAREGGRGPGRLRAKLERPDWVLSAETEALAGGTDRQGALIVLDLAAGHLAAGRIEAAFDRSGRPAAVTLSSPPKVVRQFDECLHDVYM
ncbi:MULTISPECIES: hypothetical protein [unclassified Streptomyces]|uniref:hypothetical protein n=1 Tax=unclassified Streptomyces TaxID=2593676 RepID=UPI002E2CFF8C|nr:hypothetical protein [Streptomyces sp. NBC_01439]